MPTMFKALSEVCEKLEATTKRLEMVSLVAGFLKSLEASEVEPAVSMILGRPFPKWSQRSLEVSWATLSEIIKRTTRVEWGVFRDAFSRTGDVGSATKVVFERSRGQRQSTLIARALTILEVRHSFEAIAGASGSGSREKKERLAETLFSQASSVEAKYLVKIFIGEMRTGFHEGLMEQAVSDAFHVPLEDVQRAGMILGDVGDVAKIAKTEGKNGLGEIGFKVFRPINLMLAQMADSVVEALDLHGGRTAFEYKYDGARVQIHKLGNEVRIFSRRLSEATDSLPELVETVERNVKANQAILEGEVVAVDDSGNPIPFQHLMRRFRRVHAVSDMVERIPVKLFLFDVLFLDGKNLISVPCLQRRQILAQNVGNIPLATQLVTDKLEDAESFMQQSLDAGHEGLMAKEVDSQYTPGIRGKHWLKIKPILDPLDLVIVGAEYGYGRRHDWLSDYYLAARDAETGKFMVVGKTFKGLTDAEIIEMTQKLKELTIKDEGRRVTVVSQVVVEVIYNEIQRSPKYECGMALRFARINRLRPDKTPEQADTIQKVKEIYERQFLKKGRYKTA